MSTPPTIREMQNIILDLRKFGDHDDYTLCRSWMKNMVLACADMLETIISARDWKPVDENEEDL